MQELVGNRHELLTVFSVLNCISQESVGVNRVEPISLFRSLACVRKRKARSFARSPSSGYFYSAGLLWLLSTTQGGLAR